MAVGTVATTQASATATPPPGATSAPPSAVASLRLPEFDVDSPIENIGLIPGTNQMDTPHDPHHTGWYPEYGLPGTGGNAVFSAHVDYWPDILGPFNRLDDMKPGDVVVLVMDDGTEYIYQVLTNTRYDAATIPMGDIIWPQQRPAGEDWITLITCGGDLNPACKGGPCEYLQRDVVVAQLVH